MVVALIGGIVGCGGGDSSADEVEGIAVEYLEAVDENDSDAACELQALETLEELAVFENEDPEGICPEIIQMLSERTPPVKLPEASKSEVDGEEAEVEVEASGLDSIVVELKKEDDEWKVTDFVTSG
jgi:hypothetical protein